MKDNYKRVKLEDAITFQRGFDLPQQDRTAGKHPVIAATGVVGYHNDFKVRGPGITTGRSGSLGTVIWEKRDFWPLNTTLFIKDFHNNHPKYIYYFLQTFPFEKYNSGSGVPTLNRNHISKIELSLPPLSEQKRIANILSSFDNKIEQLKKENNILENIAQTIFKEWFVNHNFPNKDGKPYKDSGGKMIDSELGLIPEGWRVGKFYEICNIDYGYPFNSKLFSESEGFPLIRIRNLQNSSTETFTIEKIDKKYIVKAGDVLVGMDGDFIITRWMGEQALLNQRVCRLNPSNNGISGIMLESLAKPYIKFLQRTNYGTTVAHLGKEDWDRFKIPIATKQILSKFNFIIKPLEEKTINNYQVLKLCEKQKHLLIQNLIV